MIPLVMQDCWGTWGHIQTFYSRYLRQAKLLLLSIDYVSVEMMFELFRPVLFGHWKVAASVKGGQNRLLYKYLYPGHIADCLTPQSFNNHLMYWNKWKGQYWCMKAKKDLNLKIPQARWLLCEVLHTALAFLPSILFFPWVWFHNLHWDSEVYPLYFGWREFCKLGTESKAAGSSYCTHAVNSLLLHPGKEKCSKAGVLQFRCVASVAVWCFSK